MDERVKKLKTSKQCEIFEKNALDRDRADLAADARLRSIELGAESHDAQTDAQREALQAIYAYEAVLSKKNGKKTRASRTWPMVKRHGIIHAVERAVNRPTETQGYKALVEMDLQQFAFEAVILRHREEFSESAVKISEERMSEWGDV